MNDITLLIIYIAGVAMITFLAGYNDWDGVDAVPGAILWPIVPPIMALLWLGKKAGDK